MSCCCQAEDSLCQVYSVIGPGAGLWDCACWQQLLVLCQAHLLTAIPLWAEIDGQKTVTGLALFTMAWACWQQLLTSCLT